MKRRYWTHLPAVAVWVGFVAWFLSRASKWPSRVPLQVGWAGEVTSWGSPWLVFGLVAGLGLFFIALTVVLDELWAQQESRKRFNFLSLLDELVLSLLVTIQSSLLLAAMDGATVYRFPWIPVLLVVGVATLVGVVIELKRPYRASADGSPSRGHATDAFRKNLEACIERRETLVFWDIQNPRYVAWVSIGVPLVLWLSAVFAIRDSGWVAALNTAVGLFLLLLYGGQRTRVSSEGITLRYGLMGIRIFRCRLDEVSGICVRTFAPLADFGGYGIRTAKGITAYYLAGRTGVQLELVNRRSVLIGSSNPERLAAAIEALTERALTSESEVAN